MLQFQLPVVGGMKTPETPTELLVGIVRIGLRRVERADGENVSRGLSGNGALVTFRDFDSGLRSIDTVSKVTKPA